MKARRFLGVVLLAVTAPCMAAPQQTPVQDELVPRTPLPKRTHLVAPQLSPLDRARGFDTRLVVKFRDDVKARPTGEGAVLSAAQTNVTEFNDRAAQAGLTFRSVFKRSFNRLALMEQRAAVHSGRAQPDLGGIMYVEGDPAALHEYGAWLLENDLVEWVEFEQVARPMIEWEQGQKPFPAASTPPPATPPGVVLDEPPADDGAAFGGGGNCGPGNGACFRANGSPGCGKFSCCTTVCSTDPFCCSTDWDADCAGAASLTCDPARACCLFNEIFELWDCADIEPFDCVVQGGFPDGGQYCSDNGLGTSPCLPTPPCCLPNGSCEELPVFVCTQQGGISISSAQTCDEVDCQSDCGNPLQNSCFDYNVPPPPLNGMAPFCRSGQCCEDICDIFAFCCDIWWDATCAGLAHLLCEIGVDPNPPSGADRCLSIFNAGCFEPHSTGGCQSTTVCDDPPNMDPSMDCCCRAVCDVNPFCCEVEWDTGCVILALQICESLDPAGPTPDFTREQGYLRRTSYAAQPGGTAGLRVSPPAPNLLGYGGQGFDLFSTAWLQDDPDETDPNLRYAGVYGIGREFAEVYGIVRDIDGDGLTDGSLTRGRSMRVAVIEWAYWAAEPFTDMNGNGVHDGGEPFIDQNLDGQYNAGHEDLDVTPEPGQTIIVNPTITEPDHATACLGIIGAREDGDVSAAIPEVGVVGIAPDAEMFFFPLTSVEDGPRFAEAFLSAYDMLGPGDITSNSWGPLITNGLTWTMLRLGADLGILNCVAAGNDCANLEDQPFLGDHGAIVVGACTPGSPFCRLTFSNHHETCGADSTTTNVVHVAAWGSNVTTTGYGDLFRALGNEHRSYTTTFNGTSAATPQIAGIAACVQGFAKQFYGIPLPPDVLRGVLQTGAAQCGVPNCPDLPGWDDSISPCGPDIDPDEEPNIIGPFPRLTGDFGSVTSVILNQNFAGFNDSPFIQGIFTLTGQFVFGNEYSVSESDDAYYVNSSHARNQGQGVEFIPPLYQEVARASYLSTGQFNDVLIVGRNPLPNNSEIDVLVECSVIGQDALVFLEAYNFKTRMWTFVTLGFIPSGEGNPIGGNIDFILEGTLLSAQDFTRQNASRDVLIRVWSLGLGGGDTLDGPGTPGSSDYFLRLDLVDLEMNSPFGTNPGGVF